VAVLLIRKIVLSLLFVSLLFVSTNEVEASSLPFDPFVSGSSAGNFYLRSDTTVIPVETDFIAFYLPETIYSVFEKGNIESFVSFDTLSPASTVSINLSDLSTDIYGIFVINFDDYGISNPDYMTIQVMQSYSIVPGGYIDFFNSNFTLTNDLSLLNVATFYVRGEIYAEVLFIGFVKPLPNNPPAVGDRFFTEWYKQDGTVFDELLFYEDDIRIYAGFRTAISYLPEPPELVPQGPDGFLELLTATGFATEVGFIIVYTLLILVVTFLLVRKIGAVFILIVNISITGAFIFMNLIPFYAATLMILIIIVGIMMSMKGGMVNE
jgi:hypothetical protein